MFNICSTTLILALVSADFKDIMLDPNSITGKFRQMGLTTNSILLMLMIALFKTSLAEEILFRGFLAKRLISIAGFIKETYYKQPFFFGIIHTVLFSLVTNNLIFLLVIFVVPGAGGYVSVYLNEKLGNGSIIPGWISHGLANILAYGIVGFVL